MRWVGCGGILLLCACACGSGEPQSSSGGPDASPPDAAPPAVEGSTSVGVAPEAAPVRVPPNCTSSAAAGIDVQNFDLDGYPPYAIDGCQLVYVSSPASDHRGALVLRDLREGVETVLAPPEAAARRPAIAGEVIAWEEVVDGFGAVRVRVGEDVLTVSGPFHHAGEPRTATDAVVFTGWLTADEDADTDVFLYTVEDASVRVVAQGIGQQRFADISTTHIAISDFSEDALGFYDSEGQADADLVLVDRDTGESVVRALVGKQAYPMLGALGVVAYLEWVGVRPMPKLSGYTIRVLSLDTPNDDAALLGQVGTDPPTIRPIARGDIVEWVEYVDFRSTLWRAPVDLSTPPIAVDGLRGLDLYAPVATDEFTVLAARRTDLSATLMSIGR